MNSKRDEDTDEEYCDDPIRLFDSDENAVYFGTRTSEHSTSKIGCWQFENTNKDDVCHARDLILSKPSERTEIPDSTIISPISESDLPKLRVKLIDCGKFPWYFRKYTQQILNKIYLNSDNDFESSVLRTEYCGYNDDCFIVEDFDEDSSNLKDTTNFQEDSNSQNVSIVQNVSNIFRNNQLIGYTVKAIKDKLKAKKSNQENRLAIKRIEEDFEIEKALSQKNVANVDFKRNIGLIGMKITKKVVRNVALVGTNKGEKRKRKNYTSDKKYINTTVDTNEAMVKEMLQNNAIGDKKYINSANKILSDFGTQLIPIPEQIDRGSNFFKEIKGDTVENNNDVFNKKLSQEPTSSKIGPVQCRLDDISEMLLDNIKLKYNNLFIQAKSHPRNRKSNLLTCQGTKLNIVKATNSSNTTIMNSENSSNQSSHVKDVEKTNKYKNGQIKNKPENSVLIQLLESKFSKVESKTTKCSQEIKEVINDIQVKDLETVRKPHKNLEKYKREPSSPILPCSTLPKKPKFKNGILDTCESNTNILKEVKSLNKIIKPDNPRNSQNKQMKTDISNSASIGKKPYETITKQVSQKETYIRDRIVNQVSDMCSNSQDKGVKNYHDNYQTSSKSICNNNQTLLSIRKNDEIIQNYACFDNVNEHSMNNGLLANSSEPKKERQIVNTENTSTSMVFSCTSEPKTADISNELHNQFKCQTTVQAVPDKMSSGYLPNNSLNSSVHNRFASAIILKPNNQFFKARCHHPDSVNYPVPVNTHERKGNIQNPNTGHYQSIHKVRCHNYLPRSVNSSITNWYPHPQDNSQQLSNLAQNQSICTDCLPQNLALPPPLLPPPTQSTPISFPLITPTNTTTNHEINKITNGSYVRPSYPPVQESHPPQGSISVVSQRFANTSPSEYSSIIGINNGGLVKKINITSRSISKPTGSKEKSVELETTIKDTQNITSHEKLEVVTTKTEMLQELDKLSFTYEDEHDLRIKNDCVNQIKQSNTAGMDFFFEKPSTLEELSISVNQKNYNTQRDHQKGYSPPILPIPTYQKVLDKVISDIYMRNEKLNKASHFKHPKLDYANPAWNRNVDKFCKRKVTHKSKRPDDGGRKDDAKKISLEEYKKRVLRNDNSSNKYKNNAKEKNGEKPRNLVNKYGENADYSTETDLGYDSDSTVVL